MRIGGEAGGEVQRYGQRGAAQPAEPGSAGAGHVQDGDVQPVLERGQRGAVDAVEEPAVGGAAAQIDVLAVVDGQGAALEGEGEAAQSWAAFDESDAHARVGELKRRGDTGQSAADHHRVPGTHVLVRHATSPRAVAVRDAGPVRTVARRLCVSGRGIRRALSDG